MFRNIQELAAYVIENYPKVTDQRIDDGHWDFQCSLCKVVRGFQVIKREVAGHWTTYGGADRYFKDDYSAPKTYLFKCPVCKSYKVWVLYEFEFKTENGRQIDYFRVTSLPNEGIEDITELPAQPASLRIAYRQAVRAMDANAHLAAAAMFRRALQVVTREVLGAKPGILANELREVVGKSYNGATITESFAEVGYIVKEAGNQGAHPDRDPDLLDFTPQDAEDLQRIFMELVSELFIVPEAVKKAKADFLARRKIEQPKKAGSS